jgi:3-oxoacyl-[acyl-carrier protein] reductase
MLGTALILGGSASVGSAVVECFAKGAHQVIATHRSERWHSPLANVTCIRCDILSAEDRSHLATTVRSMGRGLDAIIVLVGDILGKSLEATSDAEMGHLAAVNLTGPASVLRDLLPSINNGARVLLVSSIAGERGSFDPLYAATKGALIPFAKSLATWMGARMTVTVVAPGPIEGSKMLSEMTAERIEYHRKASPIGTLLTTEDFAAILYDLAQPHWRHANGSVIRINGGAYV